MKKGSSTMTKIVYSQAEFDAVVVDPQGVASVRFVGTPLNLVVEENFPFALEYAGGSTLLIRPEAGKVFVQVTRAVKVVCDNPEASLRLYNVDYSDIKRAKTVSFDGVCPGSSVDEAESVKVSGMSTVTVTKAATVSACDQSDVILFGSVGTTFVTDRVVVRAEAQARGVIRSKGVARVTLSEGSDMVAYAYDSSAVNARSGQVLATDGSVVFVAGDVSVQASGCSTVVADDEKADIAVIGRAMVVPRFWDKSDLDKWVAFTGAQDDGDSLVLYTWLNEQEPEDYGIARPCHQAHKASIADAATLLLGETDKLFKVRINKSDITELWWGRLYATKFTPVLEIHLDNPSEEK
jgi:hypothetical protein|nr:MAG TPA: hypothetical protein [Caudoviricetes sp.]